MSGSNALTKLPKSDDYSHPRCSTSSGLGKWKRAMLRHIRVKLLKPKDKENLGASKREATHYVQGILNKING